MKNYKSDDFLRVEKQPLLVCSHRNLLARKLPNSLEITRILKLIDINQESAYSPGGSKILNEPHLQQQRPYVTKTMVFHFFFLIEQLLSHVCGDIAYSAQGRPRVAYVNFMIYVNYS